MKSFLIIFFSLSTFCLNAQDIHFSQFQISKTLINPALTGSLKSDFQAIIQRRSQWSSIGSPFKTIALAFYAKDFLLNKSFGINLINDNAGESNFKTSGLNISLSQQLLENDKTIISFGALIGAFQRTFELSSLVFIEEEGIIDESMFFLDFAVGSSFFQNINNSFDILGGLSLYHINKPNQSFSFASQLSTPIKYNFHFTSNYYFTNEITVSGSLFSSKQLSYKEFIYGLDLNYDLPIDLYENNKLCIGIYGRYGDAIIPKIGINLNQFSVNILYDVNISDLAIATNNYGAFEFSISYNWNTISKDSKKHFICPKYL